MPCFYLFILLFVNSFCEVDAVPFVSKSSVFPVQPPGIRAPFAVAYDYSSNVVYTTLPLEYRVVKFGLSQNSSSEVIAGNGTRGNSIDGAPAELRLDLMEQYILSKSAFIV